MSIYKSNGEWLISIFTDNGRPIEIVSTSEPEVVNIGGDAFLVFNQKHRKQYQKIGNVIGFGFEPVIIED